jgi:hypothetical protein
MYLFFIIIINDKHWIRIAFVINFKETVALRRDIICEMVWW